MKKYVLIFFIFLYILAMSGCSDADNTEISTAQTAQDVVTDIAYPDLTFDMLYIIIEEKGEDLSFDDFADYYYDDIGSGIYLYRYPLSDKGSRTDYSLLIDYPLMNSIRLVRGDNFDDYIDIRTDDIDEFLNR